MADPAEMGLLHMISSDPARTPTFTMFADPNYFLFAGAPNCASPCVTEQPGFAWNHGDIGTDINTTWLGLVGPSVKHLGMTGKIWTDHADIRPTLMALTGLKDDYAHEGRPITEIMKGDLAERGGEDSRALAALYKRINAPVGQLSLDSAKFATHAIESSSAGDSTYTTADATIAGWATTRNALALKMNAMLDWTGPNFNDEGNADHLIDQARDLLAAVHAAAA